MYPDLRFSRRSKKFVLLNEVYKKVDSKKNQHIFSENGIRNIEMMIVCVKIVFYGLFL